MNALSDKAAVELNQLEKRFGSVRANAGVSLKVLEGTIHGIVGENGAGKSTAMKMLYGLYRPDSGEIKIRGKTVDLRSPSDAIARGIGMVHQHFMLAGPYSVLDNIVLGNEPPTRISKKFPRFSRLIDRDFARIRLDEIANRYSLKLDWDAPIESLPVGLQQRAEIVKILFRGADILILDEPTAVLTPQEVDDLFVNLRGLKSEGKTILLITHKLREIKEFTDRLTVFRQGKVVSESPTSAVSPQQIGELMVGRPVGSHFDFAKTESTEKMLSTHNLSLYRDSVEVGKPLLDQVTLDVRGGEIVGIAGVQGNGQSELLDCILFPQETFVAKGKGEITILGHVGSKTSSQEIRSLSLGVIAEDRHHQSIFLNGSVLENFMLTFSRLPIFKSKGLILFKPLREAVDRLIRRFDIRPADSDSEMRKLSGGNQQKAVIAREIFREPRLLIAAQPTRGVDIGAIETIHRQIVGARNAGAGVLLVSSELEEVLSLSDRILVFFEGRIVAEFKRGEASDQTIGMAMAGVSERRSS